MTEKPLNAFTMFKGKGMLANDKSFRRSQASAIGGRKRAQNMSDEQIKTFTLYMEDKPKKVKK